MAGSEFDDEPLYEPLHTIRLLRLPWGMDASGCDGYLVTFALNSVTCPEFVALSYTWGNPPTHSKSINLNGHEFDVLDTIYPFLKLAPELKEFSSDTWWWIDSICINQKDEKEKSSQMEIMGEIYKRAGKTVVWLGEEIDPNFSEESRDCKGSIDNLYRLCNEMDAATLNDSSLENRKLLALRGPESGVNWKAVERLLSRPWWRRVWTLQEFLISKHLRFYCGKNSISRRNLEDAIYSLWNCKGWDGTLISRRAFYAGWNRRRMNQWYEDRKHEMGLIAMLAYVGDCGASNERDRIYSLLGVAKDADMVPPLDPKLTVEDVYTNLVTSYIGKHKNLDIICYSHVFNSSAMPTNIKPLPSWVPDWRAHVEDRVIPVLVSQGSQSATGNFRPVWVRKSEARYKAAFDSDPQLRVVGDGVLFCKGIVIDRIDGLGGATYSDSGRATTHLEKEPLALIQSSSTTNLSPFEDGSVSRLLATLSRCLAVDRADRYHGCYMAPDLFQAEFEIFCKAMLEAPETVPVIFREWFAQNMSLIIEGRTLKQHCQALKPLSKPPTSEEFRNGSLKSFHGRIEDTTVTMARRLAVTEKGHLGMAACRTRKGDVVCVLFGCSVPVLLREQEEGTYKFIGECFLDGFMNGQALGKNNGSTEAEFRII